jgi:type VI secretion system protein ImpA
MAQLQTLLTDQLNSRDAAEAAAAGGSDTETGGDAAAPGARSSAAPVGRIKSRVDAQRALDSIAEFFRQNEPSSPVPLFIDRAKHLIGKDFLEILENVAPEGVASARSAGGLKDA